MLYNVLLAFAVQQGESAICIYMSLPFEPSSPSTGLRLWLTHQESACNAGDPGSIPVSGRYPGEGDGYSLFTALIPPLKVIAEQRAEPPV